MKLTAEAIQEAVEAASGVMCDETPGRAVRHDHVEAALREHFAPDITAALATARAEGKAEGVREGRLAGLREAGELCENAVVQTIRERRDWPHLPPFGNGGINMTNGMDSVDFIHMGRTDDPELEAEFWARGETIRERDEAAEREVTGGDK